MVPSTPQNEPPRELMLARRVLTMDEYIAELREHKTEVTQRLRKQFGVRIVPIPIPLAPGQSVDEYELQYRKWYRVSADDAPASAMTERANRCSHARRAAREYEAPLRKAPPRTEKDNRKPVHDTVVPVLENHPIGATGNLPYPDDVRYTRRYVELDQYRKDYKAGVVMMYKTMTKAERMAQFGVPIVPIFVPLARGETSQHYEDRFVEWIETTHKTTLNKLRGHANKVLERSLRLQFAGLNGKGVLRFDPRRFPKRKRTSSSDETLVASADLLKKPRRTDESRDLGCTRGDATSLAAYSNCNCNSCLLAAMVLQKNAVANMEKKARMPTTASSKPASRRSQDVVVVDLTVEDEEDEDDTTLQAPTTCTSTQAPVSNHGWGPRPLQVQMDRVEEQLQNEFDTINEEIVLNLEALEEADAQLANEPVEDLRELRRLQNENEELRELIHAELGTRRTALALLLLYQWRHDESGLERLLHDKAASDVDHVQRVSYRRCMTLSNEISEAMQQCAVSQHEFNDTTSEATKQQQQETQRRTRSRIDQLIAQRRGEYVVLVHFDQRVRELLLELLAAACCLS